MTNLGHRTPAPGGPGDDLGKVALDQAKARADAAIAAGLGSWWSRTDDNQKTAVVGLAAAAALGPLGLGLLAAVGKLFGAAAIPTIDQLVAVFWLFLIAAPVAFWFFAVGAFAGKASGPVVMIVAGIAAYVGGLVLAGVGTPAQLGDLYCFASLTSDGIEYRHACEAFDALGFTDAARPYLGSPSGSARVAEWAVVYVADARGSAMAIAAVIAGFCGGYLYRREIE